MATLLCYVSGHGFGHAVRVMEVLRALWVRRPDVQVAIRTPAPRWLFDFNLEGPFSHTECRLDVGAVQADSLSVDVRATLHAYGEIARQKEKLINAEVAAVQALRPAMVFADIPALAFDIAARLGVPGVAMTNFSWDWIYADYVRDFPTYAGLVGELRASYTKATLLLRLPMHGDLSAFPRIRDIPLVARTATRQADDVRAALGLPSHERIVLLSFGGIGVSLRASPNAPHGVTFIATEAATGATLPTTCRLVSTDTLRAAGVRHEDLVAACDAVMTKPGYGIVAECIANATPIIYTTRGRFAEYACLVDAIKAQLPNAFISNEDLYAGTWAPALEQLFALPRRTPLVAINGAAVAADALCAAIDG